MGGVLDQAALKYAMLGPDHQECREEEKRFLTGKSTEEAICCL
jgi:hypothetical protein